MSSTFLHNPWFILLLATLSTFIWRALGTMVAAKINPDSALFDWIACVAYALLAGLISRIIIMPVGMLEHTTVAERVGATLFGFLLFFLSKRNVFVGTLGAGLAFMALVWARTTGIL